MVTTQISSDSACKKLFRNNQRFAAFFNAIMFDGKQVIDYKTLQHQENDQSTFIDEALKENRYQKISRYGKESIYQCELMYFGN